MLQACNRAVMITAPLQRRAVETFGAQLAAKMCTINNGFDPADFASPPPPQDRLFTITYVGTILGPQVDNALPAGFRLALQQSERFRSEIRLRFVGRLDPAYRAQFNGLEDNIELIDFVAHNTGIDLMRRAHALLIVLPNNELGRMTSTNKFFEYVAARRPILALVPPGLVSEVMTRENIGVVAPPDDAAAIAQAMISLFETLRDQPDAHQSAGSALSLFDRREIARQFAGVLDEVTR